jgi:uncharacterized protein (DUF433 family)
MPFAGPTSLNVCQYYKLKYIIGVTKGGRVEQQDRVVADPNILDGKPVVKGTRVAVDFIIDLLAHGWEESNILRNYPGLTHEDIAACLEYKVLLEESDEGGYTAYVSSLPGCISEGDTKEEALKNIREAIQLYLDETSP